MADRQILPAFWSLSLDSRSRSEPVSISDWSTDDFFIARRQLTSPISSGSRSDSESEPGSVTDFSRALPLDPCGVRVLGSDSESDPHDHQIIAIGDDPIQIQIHDEEQEQVMMNQDLNLPLCWDCFRIDDDYHRDPTEEFEWEEIVNDQAPMIENEHDDDVVSTNNNNNNVEWEVLWMNNLISTEEDEGFVYANSENDEVLFAQFREQQHDSLLKGKPPAAKAVVENLPDLDEGFNAGCAICKDEIEQKGKRLPCSHCYHEECIVPWLGLRNTCPLCRHELPTDDVEYERWKARRAGNVEDERNRYEFEILPEA